MCHLSLRLLLLLALVLPRRRCVACDGRGVKEMATDRMMPSSGQLLDRPSAPCRTLQGWTIDACAC